MLKNILILVVSTIFTTCLNFGVTRAGTITETREVVGDVTMFGSSTATTGINSDDFTGGLIPGNFFYQGDINSVSPLDIVIGASESGGTSEYNFSSTLKNQTEFDWTGYKFELGFGVGNNFVKSTNFDFLDFDAPDDGRQELQSFNALPSNPTVVSIGIYNPDCVLVGPSQRFTSSSFNSNEINFSNGLVKKSEPIGFSFFVDVPDGLPNNQFTLRSYPVIQQKSIPESSTTKGAITFAALYIVWAMKKQRTFKYS